MVVQSEGCEREGWYRSSLQGAKTGGLRLVWGSVGRGGEEVGCAVE